MTGVQTCALPICGRGVLPAPFRARKKSEPRHTTRFSRDCSCPGPELVSIVHSPRLPRIGHSAANNGTNGDDRTLTRTEWLPIQDSRHARPAPAGPLPGVLPSSAVHKHLRSPCSSRDISRRQLLGLVRHFRNTGRRPRLECHAGLGTSSMIQVTHSAGELRGRYAADPRTRPGFHMLGQWRAARKPVLHGG